MSRLLGRGTYGITEAARFAQVNPGTARQWICGRGRAQKRLLKPDIPPVQNNYALSFLDLIDLLVVGRFREAGVSLQTLRKVYSRLRNTLGSAHPFSHHLLLTDGKTVFLETLDDIGDQRLASLAWPRGSSAGGSIPAAAGPLGAPKPATAASDPAGKIGALAGFEIGSRLERRCRETVSR